MGRQQQYEAMMEFLARVQAATGLPSPHIERVIANGLDISKATPQDVYKLATGRDLLGPAQAYVPPAKQNLSGAIDMPALHERPYIQEAVKMALPAVERLDPQLASRVRSGDPDAFIEVYQLVAKNNGELPAHQMELPLGDGESPSTGLIPFGVGGPGVPAGLSGPGVSAPTHGDLILARILGLNGPQRGRLPAPSILGLPGPRQARLTGPGVLGLPTPSGARRLTAASDPQMSQEQLDHIAETLFDFPDDAAHGASGVTIPADPYPAASPGHLVDDVYAPAGVTETGLSVPGVRGGGIPVGGPAGGPRGLSVPARRSGVSPLAVAAAGLAAAGGAGLAARQLMKPSSPLTDSASPESSPLNDEDLTLADDTESLTEAGNPADLVAEVSPPPSVNEMLYYNDGVRQDFTPDKEDVFARSKASLLPGTMVSPSLAIRELRVGGMNPLKAQRINDATQAVIDADRAIQRYNEKNNPWRGYGRLRPTR